MIGCGHGKILFVCYGLGIGGIEKCLVNLVNAMPEDKYDIDILLMNSEHALMNQIRRKVNFLDSFQYVMNTTDTLPEIQKRGGIIKNIGWFFWYCAFRLANKLRKKAWFCFKTLPKSYDVAIAYSQNDYSPYYVMDKVNAKRKVMWYHNGAYEGTGKKKERDSVYYSRFDYFVAVSSDCKEMLEKNFTFDNNRLIVLRNICDAERILQQAKEFVPQSYYQGIMHITTVGRMTKEKGADVALAVCEQLVKQGYKFCWHWVGDGNCVAEIAQVIIEKGLAKYFILEGGQNNPYPFILNSDIYVQPSYYEAYSTTITEAKILHRPIVTTDVGGMRDQIQHDQNGVIVPIDANEIAKAVGHLIRDKSLREKYAAALKAEEFHTKRFFKEYEKTIFCC